MSYVTLMILPVEWRLHRDLGRQGPLLAERRNVLPTADFSPAVRPIVWLARREEAGGGLERLSLPGLTSEVIPSARPALAVASSADGEAAVVLHGPRSIEDRSSLSLWREGSWRSLACPVAPDVSSRVTWLDGVRIAYEGVERRLVVLDFESGQFQVGPPGSNPAAAPSARIWFAVCQGRVCVFPFDEPFQRPPAPLEGFQVRNPTTLRVTHDGKVLTWTEPKFLYRNAGYLQSRGERRLRFREIDEGMGAALGPYPM